MKHRSLPRIGRSVSRSRIAIRLGGTQPISGQIQKWWWISAGKNGLLVYSYRYRDLYSIYLSGSRVRVGEELGNGSDADVPTGWGFGGDRFFRSTSLKMSKVYVTCRIIPGIVGRNKHNFWTLSAKNNIGHHGKKHIETHN